MSDLLKKAVSLGWGLTMASKEKVENLVDELVKRGELAPAESKEWINRLIEKGEKEQAEFKTMIQEQVKRKLQEMDVPVKSELAALEARIAELEARLARSEAEPEQERVD
ncbi:polyhydroxyalkanoate synthesis regulator [Paenibacillus profundus]|uniref:Polyhydroxyalkanoate synthesis regulator n=1 Tax=Paenibacillus profundus TaxID=1173085 RepID=A0ABS8YF16_9BACL|nr:polyhydroxyalkanoate synthesis regulator [Paenibacillus profundus]MCE5169058.1 polyhydroxyalkanoate synthesis regulator [Paenibacillus profundus]